MGAILAEWGLEILFGLISAIVLGYAKYKGDKLKKERDEAKALIEEKFSGYKKIAVAGGVSANSELRRRITEECEKRGYSLYYPDGFVAEPDYPVIASEDGSIYRMACEKNAIKISMLTSSPMRSPRFGS